jgi:hypothetical protein
MLVSDIGSTGRTTLSFDWGNGEGELWFCLGVLQHYKVKIGSCPVCRKFFADPKGRGKSACSPKCANLNRARAHYEKLKANRRKYHAYLKKQADLMRARRAAGLA